MREWLVDAPSVISHIGMVHGILVGVVMVVEVLSPWVQGVALGVSRLPRVMGIAGRCSRRDQPHRHGPGVPALAVWEERKEGFQIKPSVEFEGCEHWAISA